VIRHERVRHGPLVVSTTSSSPWLVHVEFREARGDLGEVLETRGTLRQVPRATVSSRIGQEERFATG